ncbi:MAG: type II secretion system F family protein [Cyanobacteria bacterium P01_H01_bin.74]
MTYFQYEAFNVVDKAKSSGTLSANSEREARELLREKDLIPVSISVIDQKNKTGQVKGIAGLLAMVTGIGAKDIIAFTRNMCIMIRAGIPLTDALLYYENYSVNAAFKKIVHTVRQDILSGYAMSQALGKHTKLFDELYVNVTHAGEKSGELDKTLDRLSHLLDKAEQLKMKIISASAYPVIVLFILTIVLLIMFLLVLPTFSEIYEQMNLKLPLITKILLLISHVLVDYWFISFPAMGLFLFLVYKYVTSSAGKVVIDNLLLKIPVINDLLLHTQAAHFVSTLLVGFSSGLPITDSLHLATQTLTHTQIKAAYKKVNVQIQTGQKLATALAETGYVPNMVMLMISTGEESGELDKMLQVSYEYLEEEVNHKVGILTTMMEPIMLLVIGAVVGFVALGIYLPMFSIYDGL